MADPASLDHLRPEDAATLAGRAVVRAHRNESHWWNHASFALPLLGCIGFVVIGLLTGKAEALGFGVFLGAVTVLMLPVVYFTWRGTATVVALTEEGAIALHAGRLLQEVRWAELERIERVETLGNVRWKLEAAGDHRVTIEGEIADVPALIEGAYTLSGLPRDAPEPHGS